MRKFLVILALLYYFIALRVYHESYSVFIRHRQEGVAFELLTAFNLELPWFFWGDLMIRELSVYGAHGIPELRTSYFISGPPISILALWGESPEYKLAQLRRNTAWGMQNYLSLIQWFDGVPRTGHSMLTHIATHSEVIRPRAVSLSWRDRSGTQKHTSPSELTFTTDIYNIANIWLVVLEIEPTDADPSLLEFIATQRHHFLDRAITYSPGKFDRSLMFTGLRQVQRVLSAGAEENLVANMLYAAFVLLPTTPIMWLIFTPMFFVPCRHIGLVSTIYYCTLVGFGVVAFLYLVWRSASRARLKQH